MTCMEECKKIYRNLKLISETGKSSLPGDRAAFSDREMTSRHVGAKRGMGEKITGSKCRGKVCCH